MGNVYVECLMLDVVLSGHTIRWALGHEAWHFVLSLSFSVALLLGVFFLNRELFWRIIQVSSRISLIRFFLLSVSLALLWHFVLDIKPLANAVMFWW